MKRSSAEKTGQEEQDDRFKTCLTPQQYRIMRLKGTELPFTGKYVKHDKEGNYVCAACGNVLFSSDTKFDSGTGWPSFYDAASKGSVELRPEKSLLGKRIEVVCRKCKSHLGHVFDDGPEPTGRRYCINSLALGFKEKRKEKG